MFYIYTIVGLLVLPLDHQVSGLGSHTLCKVSVTCRWTGTESVYLMLNQCFKIPEQIVIMTTDLCDLG